MPLVSTPKIGALAVSISRDRSSATRCCSAVMALICVMSCPTQITPMTSPFGPRRVVAFNSTTAFFSPSLTRGNSKLGVCSPLSAFSSTWPTESLNSSAMKFDTRDLPIASSYENCDNSANFKFHSVTRPWMSTPKIGAPAVSMMRPKSSAMRSASVFCCFNSVMSWPTPSTPMMEPSSPRLGVAFRRTSRRLPALVNNGSSKFATSIPWSAFCSTSDTEERYSKWMKVFTRCLPMVSSRL
mmetsp:Transcript_25068/g.72287  ORF Transcript_25068/g.72287 Transcript_25068/m.72287 type:complete len:241 (+) Transcript_25068:411-1133(+)